MRGEWYYAENWEPIGPITFDALVDHLRTSPNSGDVQVWRDGLEDWQAAKDIPELFDSVFRPPPLPQERKIAARSVPMGEAIGGKKSALGQIAVFVALTAALWLGGFFSIYENSPEGIERLVGEFTPSALLKGVTDPSEMERLVKEHPTNQFLKLTATTYRAALETNRLTRELFDEIEPPALAKDPDLATAKRPDLEKYRHDLRTAETNATEAMTRYVVLLKDERARIVAFANTFDLKDEVKRQLLIGIDNRHARFTAYISQMLSARAQFYRAFGKVLDILIEQSGTYKVQASGQFVFSSPYIADRYTALANEINTASKRVAELEKQELEKQGEQLAQFQQEGWIRFVSGK